MVHHLFMQIKNIYEKGYQLSYALAKISVWYLFLGVSKLFGESGVPRHRFHISSEKDLETI